MSLSTLFRFSSLTSLWHFDISLFISNIIHMSLGCSLFSCSVKTAAVSLLLGFNCFKNALISKRIISTYRQRTLRVHFIPDRRKERKEERKWEQIVISKCLNFKRDYLKQTGREEWEFISYPIFASRSRLNFDTDRQTEGQTRLKNCRSKDPQLKRDIGCHKCSYNGLIGSGQWWFCKVEFLSRVGYRNSPLQKWWFCRVAFLTRTAV